MSTITPRIVTYLDLIPTWYPPATVLQDVLSGVNRYTHMNLAFWLYESGPVDIALAWSDGTFPSPSESIQELHAAGVKVLVSAGGSTETAISSGYDPTDYGKKVATFAVNNNLDGIDFDIEDTAAFTAGTATDWLVKATVAARGVFPNAIISHAPQAPYFMTPTGGNPDFASNYIQVEQQLNQLVQNGTIPAGIDFYNVQFYNQGSSDYATYQSLFVKSDGWATETAVAQIAAKGIDGSKIIVGKPATPSDASNGYVTSQCLAWYIQKYIASGGIVGGAMSWQWLSDINSGGQWSETVLKGFTGNASDNNCP